MSGSFIDVDEPRKCYWVETHDLIWETGCLNKHQFVDGGPAHNAYAFCPFCGGDLVELLTRATGG